MLGHSEGQVESCTADPHGAAVDPGSPVSAEPRRPAGQRRGRAVEGERERGDPEREGVDAEIRYGQLNSAPALTHQCLPDARHTRTELTYIMILRVQVMLYTLDRVTCEETIVDKFYYR